MHDDPDPHALLGVAPTASADELTQAFRAKLRSVHPDAGPQNSAAFDGDQLQRVLAAYLKLRQRGRQSEPDGSDGFAQDPGAGDAPVRL